MHKILTCSLMACLIFTFSTAVVAGKVYKWTDAAGNTIYSQTPPPSQKNVEEMDVKAPKPSTPPAESKPASSASSAPAGKQQPGNKEAEGDTNKEQEAKNEEIRKENCKNANTRMRTISAGGRIYEVNEKGERVYWDDSTIKSKLEEAQKAVEEWCK